MGGGKVSAATRSGRIKTGSDQNRGDIGQIGAGDSGGSGEAARSALGWSGIGAEAVTVAWETPTLTPTSASFFVPKQISRRRPGHHDVGGAPFPRRHPAKQGRGDAADLPRRIGSGGRTGWVHAAAGGERAVRSAQRLFSPRRRSRGRRHLPPHPAHAHPPPLPRDRLQMDSAVPSPLLLYSLAHVGFYSRLDLYIPTGTTG